MLSSFSIHGQKGGKDSMSSVQYVIDSICSSVTVECVYKIIEGLLSQGTFPVDDILPLIQTKDRSLDSGSAKMIAEAALNDLTQRDIIRIESGYVHSAHFI
jgi:hypothetical protein